MNWWLLLFWFSYQLTPWQTSEFQVLGVSLTCVEFHFPLVNTCYCSAAIQTFPFFQKKMAGWSFWMKTWVWPYVKRLFVNSCQIKVAFQVHTHVFVSTPVPHYLCGVKLFLGKFIWYCSWGSSDQGLWRGRIYHGGCSSTTAWEVSSLVQLLKPWLRYCNPRSNACFNLLANKW